ncbi:hypothetical protein BS47DRAFT_580536 [Hydnum rufescens UP504]|uniref:Uncharacterized protein n=1 Tax=Hydnum rufescens UP504 TaxID=1448309 RepID=A0A9P6DNC6_9AGAM|nr:hypothetical protein BS47DRAFT_580536 [Hydnum rufescens UP504]
MHTGVPCCPQLSTPPGSWCYRHGHRARYPMVSRADSYPPEMPRMRPVRSRKHGIESENDGTSIRHGHRSLTRPVVPLGSFALWGVLRRCDSSWKPLLFLSC